MSGGVSDAVLRLNQQGWDRRVAEGDVWTRPVPVDGTAHAAMGDRSILLTLNRAVPRDWFGAVDGRRILCLAAGGGQQGPVLAAACTDAALRQLAQDEAVAARDGLTLRTVQGFMHDLSAFSDESFDIVVHPASNCFAPEIASVWRECFRVLRPAGVLLAGFMNPDAYVFDAEAQARDELVVRHKLPFAETDDLPPEERERLIARDHVVEYSHSLQGQIGGQCEAGFLLAGFYEDGDLAPLNTARSRVMPVLFATPAIKPAGCISVCRGGRP